MNKFFRALIGIISLGVLVAFIFVPVITLTGDSYNYLNIVELAIEAVKNTEWGYAVLFGIFVLLIGIPVLCFLILAIVHNFKLLTKPQRIRVGNQVYTALFFLLVLVFFPKLLMLFPDTAPDWFPDATIYSYLVLLKNNQSLFNMGVILYIAIGACVAIIVLKIMGNVALRTAYKLANTQGGTFNDSNAGIGYCRNCGNTVSPNDRFCRRCGERI